MPRKTTWFNRHGYNLRLSATYMGIFVNLATKIRIVFVCWAWHPTPPRYADTGPEIIHVSWLAMSLFNWKQIVCYKSECDVHSATFIWYFVFHLPLIQKSANKWW